MDDRERYQQGMSVRRTVLGDAHVTRALKSTNDFNRMYIRAALSNGITREEIKEVLLQAAVYCGVPAGNAAFRTADAAFAEIDAGS
jgi:hypothetical protein